MRPSLAALLLTRAVVELQLQRELDVVGQRPLLVVVESVVQDGEDALRRDRIGGVGEHGTQHVPASCVLQGVTRGVCNQGRGLAADL